MLKSCDTNGSGAPWYNWIEEIQKAEKNLMKKFCKSNDRNTFTQNFLLLRHIVEDKIRFKPLFYFYVHRYEYFNNIAQTLEKTALVKNYV